MKNLAKKLSLRILSLALALLILFSPLSSYAASGSLDASFDSDGKVTTTTAGVVQGRSAAIQSDGKIVVAGWTNNAGNFDFAIARYNTNGSLDTDFDTDGIALIDFATFPDFAYATVIQPDGKIVVAGSAVTIQAGLRKFAIARLNTNGTLDTSFDADGKITQLPNSEDVQAQALLVQSNGKIVIGGFRPVAGGDDFALIRLNSDGTPDTSFGNSGSTTTDFGASGNTRISSMALLSNGKIIAVGEADTGDNIDMAIARYNSNGNLDTTFGTSGKTILDIAVDSTQGLDLLEIQPDNKIVVGGFVNDSDFALARLNSGGSLDTGFGTNGIVSTDFGGNDQVRAIAIQSDGKIIASGWAEDADLNVAIARYSSSGSLDTTFGTGGKVTTDFGGDDFANSLVLSNDLLIMAGTKSENSIIVARYQTLSDESASQAVASGETVDMDTENDGATASDPVETAITSPNSGTVTVEETSPGGVPTSGYTFVGEQISITAPAATAENPLVLTFEIDASVIPVGQTKDTIQIFRNGVLVLNCTTGDGTATPDPCVSLREDIAGGDVRITVLTSQASFWNIAVPVTTTSSTNPGSACSHTNAPDNTSDNAEQNVNPNSAVPC